MIQMDMMRIKLLVCLTVTTCFLIPSVAGSEKCGNDLVETSGSFQSPLYPRPTFANVTCTWTFKFPGSKAVWVYITFDDFQLQLNDTLEIIDQSPTGKFVHNFNGVRGPFTVAVKSEGSIEFKTKSSAAFFHATYTNNSCGGNLTLELGSNHEVVESPLYAKRSSPDNFVCTWTISQSEMGKFNFLMSFIKVNLSGNRLELFKGATTDPSRSFANLTGHEIIDDRFIDLSVTLQLHVNVTEDVAEFSTEFQTISPECSSIQSNMRDPVNITVQTAAWLPATCVQMLKSEENTTLLLNLVDVNLFNENDMLILNEGTRRYSPNIKTLTFADKMGKDYLIATEKNAAFILFWTRPVEKRSNFSIEASVQAVGGNFYNSGKFSLPPYLNGRDVVFSLNSNELEQVEASVTAKNLKPDNLILFYDVSGNDKYLLANFTSQSEFRPVFSMTNKMLIVAKNFNGSETFEGSFHSIPRGCDNYDRSSIGSYELKRNDTGNCTWLIKADNTVEGNYLALTFSTIRLGPGDKIAVYRGFTRDPNTLIKVFNSSINFKPVFYIEATNGIRVDSQIVSPPETKDEQLKAFYELEKGCDLEINVTSSSVQEISSLGYPGNYPLNINCTWILKPTANKSLFLKFSDVDIYEEHLLSIYALKNKSWQLITSTNGKPYPDDLILQEDELLIMWNSSSRIEGPPVRGFSIEARILQCGGNLTTESGKFETPAFGNTSEYCIWGVAIPVPDRQKPNIVQLSVNGNVTENITNSILEIHDGGSLTSNLLSLPKVNASSLSRTNKLLVKYTPTSSHHDGYKFSFSSEKCKEVCNNGICMHPNWRCDGRNDCGDYSDELNCDSLNQKPGVSIAWFSVGMCLALVFGIVLTIFVPVGIKRFREWRLRYQDFRTLPDE